YAYLSGCERETIRSWWVTAVLAGRTSIPSVGPLLDVGETAVRSESCANRCSSCHPRISAQLDVWPPRRVCKESHKAGEIAPGSAGAVSAGGSEARSAWGSRRASGATPP